jgi:hypothetical protein
MKLFSAILLLSVTMVATAGIGHDNDYEHEHHRIPPPLPEVSTWAAGFALVAMVGYAAWKRSRK